MARVLIVAGDGSGPELEYGVFRMREEGMHVTVAAPVKKPLFVVFHQQEEGWDHGIERPWYVTKADAAFEDVDPAQYDGLLLPGGRAPVYLRNFDHCNRIVQHFMQSTKPISAICRGPIVLVGAGARGRRFTGNPLIRPRVEMGGCTFVETRGEPIRDGNVVTISGRPYYHVWIREFLKMLRTPGRAALRRSA
jgi:protease I